MIPVITASKVYSILGNNNSLVPLAIKDVANSVGLTAGSYVVGKEEEGQDRFIDEFGTQALWLFGIPGYKKLLDFVMFKTMGYDPKIDVRVLKNKDIFEKAKEFAHNDNVKAAFEKVGKNQKTFKGLTFAKFAVSTLMTIGTYGALTHYRHKFTEESIKKKIIAEHKQKQQANTTFTPVAPKPEAFKGVSVKNDENREQVAFKGGISDFMFSPVKNLMILDGAISGERLLTSRNMQDFLGYGIKEGSFWVFMYYAGQKIQNHLEKSAETKHNKSIDLDARVIESDELKKAFHDNSLKKSIDEFANCKTDVEVYEFINKNPDNFIVKMAKKSDIVKTKGSNENLFVKLARRTGMMGKLDNADVVDTRAYIDIDEFKGVANKLEKLHGQYEKSGESLEKFLGGVKKLKRASVWKNMGSCIFALGVLAPAIMVATRILREDKEFKVKEKIEKELAFQGEI
ncbi:MAG: hypothetical protein NC390_05675 [Fusobacterium sp.]|nr:hypothetical protein [Fusobacterium sp.]